MRRRRARVRRCSRTASRKSVASRSADTVDGIASSSPSSSSPLDDDDDDDDDDDTARGLTPTLAPSTSPRARRGDERMRCPIDRSRTTTRERRADDARMPRRRRRRARTLDERLEFHARAIGREEDDARRRETRERVTNAESIRDASTAPWGTGGTGTGTTRR